jgi:hypothetical protein
MKPTDYIADFDSATAMVRALGNYLNGEDFPLLGAMPRKRAPLMRVVSATVNQMPNSMREQVYIWSGRFEAISAKKLPQAKTDAVAEWMTSLYPRRRYPAVAIGSSNGAATHLWAALGVPWLPQTFLIPVARSGPHPDEPIDDIKWAQQPARTLLETNPDVQLHHLHDPNQDRLMIQRMTYFRVKRLRLGAAYEKFLEQVLEPGGTIFIVECGLQWPTTRYGPRHVFQFGALGGATIDEYLNGGRRVENYLKRHRSHRRRWQPPQPNGQSPEAEWGFEPALREDLISFAERHGYRIKRIIFNQPEHMSPLVADFYSWWNTKRGLTDRRLLVESFIVMEPYWTTHTGSVPFWMVFNKEPSLIAVRQYLQERDPFDEIYMMLFSHGVNSIGLVSIGEWREILKLAKKRSAFIGVDESAYPRDFAVFVRYYEDLQRKIDRRYPLPPPLPLTALDEFLDQTNGRYQVEWLQRAQGPGVSVQRLD